MQSINQIEIYLLVVSFMVHFIFMHTCIINSGHLRQTFSVPMHAWCPLSFFLLKHVIFLLSNYYASVGRAPEAYGSRHVCVSVCMSFTCISLQWLKTKR